MEFARDDCGWLPRFLIVARLPGFADAWISMPCDFDRDQIHRYEKDKGHQILYTLIVGETCAGCFPFAVSRFYSRVNQDLRRGSLDLMAMETSGIGSEQVVCASFALLLVTPSSLQSFSE